MPYIIITLFCVIGAGLGSYSIGRKKGIGDAIDHFAAEGIISLAEEED